MAALGYLSEENNQDIDFKCGGSLISERYILTAAHCSAVARLQPIIARLGSLNIKNPEVDPDNYGDVLDVNIESVILHPNYVSFKNYDDIALVHLTEVVKFNGNLHPACLNSDISDILPSTELIITGWGKVNTNDDTRSPFLLKTNLTVVNLSECNSSLSKFFGRKLPTGLNLGHFCAYDPNGLSDACQGDSGGPIQIIDNITDDRAMPIIVGITSFGIACGTKLPSIYARVAFYLDWIESIVWPN
jgi:secreted trypsin-like serine protease